MLEAGQKYIAEVVSTEATEKEDGTYGVAVRFKTDEGDFDHTIWVEQGEFLKYRKQDLAILGATEDNLIEPEWLQSPSFPVGRKVSIVMSDFVDKKTGKTRLKVKYINAIRREASASAANRAAALFSGKPLQDEDPFGPPAEPLPF